MRLLKVCVNKKNIYVDLNGDKYRLRVYDDELVFDQEYSYLNKLNKELKALGLGFRVSDDCKQWEFAVISVEDDYLTIKFIFKGQTIYSTIKRGMETEAEVNAALDLIVKVWESVYGGVVHKRLLRDDWRKLVM